MPLPLRTLVLVNPAAGRGRAGRLAPVIEALLRSQGFAGMFAVAADAAELTSRAARARDGGFECVAVLGGDGAVHFVLRGLFPTGVPLAIIPAGTGNDIATALGMPRDPIAAAGELHRCVPRPVDVLRVRFADDTSHVFIGAGGCGLDAEANILANTTFKSLPGAARYVAGALWALRRSEPLALSAELDGKPWNGEVMLAAVANIRTYGAGVVIAPAAAFDDGMLDVTLIRPLPLQRIIEALPLVLRDGLPRWPEIAQLRARAISLRAGRQAPFHGDGELLGNIPAEVEVLPGALQVIAPPRGT